ncbi:DNA repair protein RadC [Wolbachia endosymbiont of Cylisticus convexus]|uniref:JAB domain-containing protein n=1 Tax=Wolbachia endosymbiont of Cylisticus convexus TaxID=118728 RepID=UPI000DF6FD0E|nr:DNA repair protein RadC [Wolbachia endosymbiont of Cylisticus convexus]RDD35400.1 DNA repair protein RadC [Wolbachia endosymbiont of Cylisticus convexus]
MNNSEDKRKGKLETRILSSRGRSLLDHELLELILYSVCEKGESRNVAEKLIALFNSVGKVISADLYELKSVVGMNDASVASIQCVREIIKRILKGKLEELSIMDNREKLIEYLKATIGQFRKEGLRVIYLDPGNRLVHEYVQDTGTVNKTPFYIREIVKRGLLVEAMSAIVAHNHPSGDQEPSEEDEKNTRKLELACDNVGIKLMDHVIITEKSHFSFYDNGLM